ncbi:IS110 family transposase [Parasutterella excrementihominis]|jgi:transposase
MSRMKRLTVQQLDVSMDYLVIGLDLAKTDTAVIAITTDGELYAIDRLKYLDLLNQAKQLGPTVFAMEPCNGMTYLVHELEELGHECRVINGEAVKDYVKSHFAGQKNDLNDAQAIAFLAQDEMLKFIRTKAKSEMTMQTLQVVRQQLIKQRTCSVVCIKGICQNYGLIISKSIMSEAKIRPIIEESQKLPEEIKEPLKALLRNAARFTIDIKQIDKAIEQGLKGNDTAERLLEVPGLGPQCVSRLLTTIGDINRFEGPKNLAAYYGLVPRSHTTGHNEQMGKITKHGDRLMRSFLVQGAHAVLILHTRGRLPKSALKKWIDKKLSGGMPRSKLSIALAAKLLRIAFAVLKYKKKFDIKKAGVARCSL